MLGTDQGREHSVAVYKGLVWDTNDPFAQDLSLYALDRAVGFCNGDALFAGYVQRLVLTPHKKLRQSKLRQSRDIVDPYITQRFGSPSRHIAFLNASLGL